MVRIKILIILFLLTTTSYAHAKNLVRGDVLGDWQVSDVLCSGCQDRSPSEKGTIIRLNSESITNPLSDDCKGKPGYNLLKTIPWKTFLKLTRSEWPDIGQQQGDPQKEVLYGFITCNGINHMQIAFLSDNTAVYLYEGGLAFVLRRIR